MSDKSIWIFRRAFGAFLHHQICEEVFFRMIISQVFFYRGVASPNTSANLTSSGTMNLPSSVELIVQFYRIFFCCFALWLRIKHCMRIKNGIIELVTLRSPQVLLELAYKYSSLSFFMPCSSLVCETTIKKRSETTKTKRMQHIYNILHNFRRNFLFIPLYTSIFHHIGSLRNLWCNLG